MARLPLIASPNSCAFPSRRFGPPRRSLRSMFLCFFEESPPPFYLHGVNFPPFFLRFPFGTYIFKYLPSFSLSSGLIPSSEYVPLLFPVWRRRISRSSSPWSPLLHGPLSPFNSLTLPVPPRSTFQPGCNAVPAYQFCRFFLLFFALLPFQSDPIPPDDMMIPCSLFRSLLTGVCLPYLD